MHREIKLYCYNIDTYKFKQQISFYALFILVNLFFHPILAQFPEPENKYKQVDIHVKKISRPLIFHPDVLIDSLTIPFDKEEEKVRAIFVWIATNIEYNYIAFKNGVELIQNVNEVLVSGKALCYGYSLVFQEFCKLADIKCEIVEGYAKGLGYTKGQKFEKPNHAWNAVMLDNKWYLMDVTWASGVPRQLSGGERNIDLESFFMADPKEFIEKHLPEDPTWQLLTEKKTLEEFEKDRVKEATNGEINAYSPKDYEGLNEYEKDILQYKRTLAFNPDYEIFAERLSFAHIYKAISLTDDLWKLEFEEISGQYSDIIKQFQAHMDSAWQVIDPIPLVKIQKNKRIIREEINYQTGIFYFELASQIFNKGFNQKISVARIEPLTSPLFKNARMHFSQVPANSIYLGDARDYLRIIDKYESRSKNP